MPVGGLILLVAGLTWIGVTTWFRVAFYAVLRIEPTARDQQVLLLRLAAGIAFICVFSGVVVATDSAAPRILLLVPIVLGLAALAWFVVLLRDGPPLLRPHPDDVARIPARRAAFREGLRRPAVWLVFIGYAIVTPLLVIGLVLFLGALTR